MAKKATSPVSWLSLAPIFASLMIGSWYLIVGGVLAGKLSFWAIILSILLGNLLLCCLFYIYGGIGKSLRKPTAEILKYSWGEKGSRFLPSPLIAIGQFGWFIIGCEIAGVALAKILGVASPIGILIFSLAMAAIVMKGVRALNLLGWIAVVGTILLMVYSLNLIFVQTGWTDIWNYSPPQTISLWAGIDIVVAALIAFTVVTPDFLRFANMRKDVILAALAGVIPAALLVGLVGAILTIAAGTWDLNQILLGLNLPTFAHNFLLVSTLWAAASLYPVTVASSSIAGRFSEKRRARLCLPFGLLGAVLASFGIVSRFIGWLKFLGIFFPPIIGIVLADYYFIKRKRYKKVGKKFNWPSFISWALAVVIAYFIPVGITSLNGLFIAFLFYYLLSAFFK